MDSFKEKCDIYRPGNDTIRANRVHMCLSRIDKPLKRSNNNKGELKLMNHAQVLGQLGESWISKYVPDQLYTIDLLDLKNHSSYIEKSKDYQLFTRPSYNIITRSTLYKLQNYFDSNKRFTVDKKKNPIKLCILPTNAASIHLPREWMIRANVKELLHQLSLIQY